MTSLDQFELWPLVVVIEDCHVPRTAAPLLRALRNLDDDSSRVSILLWAEEAASELGGQRN